MYEMDELFNCYPKYGLDMDLLCPIVIKKVKQK